MSGQRKGGWGSLLSGAVAGLESRLDTILAEDGTVKPKEPEAASKQEGADKAAAEKKLQLEPGA